MANTIAYAKAYKEKLDEVYKLGAKTAILEAAESSYKFNQENAQEILLQKLSIQGLGTYARDTGYAAGNADITWETHTFGQDRGRKFLLDTMDAKEAKLQVGRLMSEMMRVNIIPEIDAYRFSKMYTLCGVDVSADLTVDNVVAAIDTGIETLDDAEVGQENRVLFVSNGVYNLLKNSGEFFSTRVTHDNMVTKLNRNITMLDDIPLIRVPSARFNSSFTFNAAGAGGFTATGDALNFMIVPLTDVIAVIRHMAPKLVDPKYNTDADGWVFANRLYHDLFIPENKLDGVYIHKTA